MVKVLHRFFNELDIFAANPTLRSKCQPYIATPCLGVFSLVILGFFLWLFIANMIQIATFSPNQISSSKSYEKSLENETFHGLMFGVRFQAPKKWKVEDYEKYFQMAYRLYSFDQRQYMDPVPLKPCKPEQWKALGDNYEQYFYKYRLNISYCPTQAITADIRYQKPFIQILFSKCNPSTSICAPRAELDNQIKTLTNQIANYPVWVNFLSAVVQIKEKNPLNYFVNFKRLAISPDLNTTTVAYVKLNKLQVKTDSSIWPIFKSLSTEAGFTHLLEFVGTEEYYDDPTISEDDNQTQYLVKVTLEFSQQIESYQRNINKADGVLSYVGGLFGLVFFALQFFLGHYNEYRYELKVGESSFDYSDDGHKVREGDLNGFMYLKYTLYNWMKTLFCYKPNWKDCDELHATRLESLESLDISKFFRRIEFIERVMWKHGNPDALRCVAIIEPSTIHDVARIRKIYEYYRKIIRNDRIASVKEAIKHGQIAMEYIQKLILEIPTISKTMSQEKPGKQELKTPQKQKQVEEKEQIKKSLMEDLGLEHCEEICEKIAEYHLVAEDAKAIKLDKEFVGIEEFITAAFISLPPNKKKEIIVKFPIKILHRLRIAAKRINKDRPKSGNQNNAESKEKEHRNELNQIFFGLLNKKL